MGKVIALNGSPRRNGNTATLLEKALEGAAAAGAETKLVHLADMKFGGCYSCFACKRICGVSFGRCGYPDELHGLLNEILEADAVILGSPIYFGDVTGMLRNVIERLLFPNCLYDKTGKKAYDKQVPVGIIFTMNAPSGDHCRGTIEHLKGCLGNFLGPVESLEVVNTLQFDDYSKYSSSMFDVEDRKRWREEQFPKDMQSAYEMGQKLLKK